VQETLLSIVLHGTPCSTVDSWRSNGLKLQPAAHRYPLLLLLAPPAAAVAAAAASLLHSRLWPPSFQCFSWHWRLQ
jgi:hypothetical protein